MQRLLLTLFTLTCSYAWGQPIIQQIIPAAAPPGTQVTISGQGFHSINDSNIVYFGAVRAQLVSSSATSIVAVVPLGATHDFVTVTTQRRTAYSKAMFLPNGGAGEIIGSKMFNSSTVVNYGFHTSTLATADLDGNGYVDLATLDIENNRVRVLKNTTTTPLSNISFQTLDLTISSRGAQVAIGDVNSDGKPDIVISLNNTAAISILLNTSTPGNFSFSPEKKINTPLKQWGITVFDIDGDGKVDIISANPKEFKISILRNISESTDLVFDTTFSYYTSSDPTELKVADFDGNGKHDIAFTNIDDETVSILKNLSNPGNINFNKTDLNVIGTPRSIAIGDLNNNGKPDFITGISWRTSFALFENNSSGGDLSFNRKNMPWGNFPMAVGIDDLDADGKPDMVVAGADSILTIYQNNGIGNNISFRDSVSVKVTIRPSVLSIADLDNNGHPDIILGNYDGIYIHNNRLLQPAIHSFSPSSGSFDSIITIFGKHFSGSTAVFFGNSNFPAKSFSVINDSTIRAVVDIGYSGTIRVTNPFGVGISPVSFTFVRMPPIVHSVFPVAAKAGALVTIKGKDFDNDPSKNIVKFETAIAQVIAASDSILLVRVPANAIYGHVTVTRNATTGYSPANFIPAFSGSSGSFSSYSFEHVLDSATGAGPVSIGLGDFNLDGRNDVGIVSSTAGRLSLYRRNGDSSAIGFRTGINVNLAAGVQGISLTDIYGVGSVNFAVANSIGGGMWLLFKSPVDNDRYSAFRFSSTAKPFKVKSRDLNGDGTPDLATISKELVQNGSNGQIQLRKNESTGSFGFFPNLGGLVLNTDLAPTDLLIEDFDGDGKPDIIVSDSLTGLSVFRNISTLDFAFSSKVALTGNTNIQAIAAMDIDKDGKMDIIAAGLNNNVRIYRNESTAGNIAFTVFETNITSAGYKLSIADIDGDGHADVGVCLGNTSNVLLLRNSGQFPVLFSSSLQFAAKNLVTDLAFADLDGDSKPEMITVDFTSNKFSVYKNQIGGPANFYLCSGKSGMLTGDISGTNYQWQVNKDSSGYQNISDTSLYAGFDSQALTLKQTLGSWYGYRYRLVADGKQGSEYVLKFRNQWMGSVSNSWNIPANWSCSEIPDANTDVIIESGSVQIDSAIVIRSLKVSPGVQISVSTSGSLTILK
jgi:hypothetical protein